MSEYGDNIRRIARVKDKKEGSNDPDEKGTLIARRGIAFLNPDGSLAQSISSTPGSSTIVEVAAEEAAKGAVDAATDAFKKALQQAQNSETTSDEGQLMTNSPEAPSTTEGEGVFTAQDIIDGVVDAAKLAASSLNGISDLTDPQTSQEFTARFDGEFMHPVIDAGLGIVAIGSDGDGAIFADSNSAGTFAGFQSGYYWTATNPASAEGAVPAIAAARSVGAARDGLFPNAFWDPGSLVQVSITEWRFTWYENAGLPANNVSMFRQTCPGSLSDSCPVSSPTMSIYPTWRESTLSYQPNGLITSSQFDNTPLGQAYRDGTSILVGKFDGGTRTLVIEPGTDNSRLVYEVDSSGSPIGSVFQFNVGALNTYSQPGFITGYSVVKPRSLRRIISASDISKYRQNTNYNLRVQGITLK